MAVNRTVVVGGQSDVEAARRAARELAAVSKLGKLASEEWILVASELASNLLFHANKGGELRFSYVEEPRQALVIESVDSGPGITNIKSAMSEGFSTRGGLGGGLPTIEEFSDELNVDSTESGTRITVKKWIA